MYLDNGQRLDTRMSSRKPLPVYNDNIMHMKNINEIRYLRVARVIITINNNNTYVLKFLEHNLTGILYLYLTKKHKYHAVLIVAKV